MSGGGRGRVPVPSAPAADTAWRAPGSAERAVDRPPVRSEGGPDPLPAIGHGLIDMRIHRDATPGTVLRRAMQVHASVESDLQSDPAAASACLVHVHASEQNAKHVAQQIRRERCTNFVWVENRTRRLVRITDPGLVGEARFDPNRMFVADAADIDLRSETGDFERGNTPSTGTISRHRRAAKQAAFDWKNAEFMPVLEQGRGGPGAASPLPVVAFHNNTDEGPLSIHSYSTDPAARSGTDDDNSSATARDLTDAAGDPVANPHINPALDADDILYVTHRADFDALSALDRNVVLQAPGAELPEDAQDGSLSVAMAGDRYINVEQEGNTYTSDADALYVTNLARANEVMDMLGVPRECPAPPGGETEERSAE